MKAILLILVSLHAGLAFAQSEKNILESQSQPTKMSVDELISYVERNEADFSAAAVEVTYFLAPALVKTLRTEELRVQIDRLARHNVRSSLLRRKLELQSELDLIREGKIQLAPEAVTERYFRSDFSTDQKNPFGITSFMGAPVTKITLLDRESVAKPSLFRRAVKFCSGLLRS